MRNLINVVHNKGFTRKGSLEQHLHLHTGDNPYECKTCHKRFTYSSGLRYHEATHTGGIRRERGEEQRFKLIACCNVMQNPWQHQMYINDDNIHSK